ncbi:MAG: efflux RND transporter periplasmic adaptor subunit [Terriglobales bacterium]
MAIGFSPSPDHEHDLPAVLPPGSVFADDSARAGATHKSAWVVAILVAVLVVVLALAFLRPSGAPAATNHFEPVKGVACLGHIEPADGVRIIGARSLSGQPSLMGELQVREGDSVRAGQVLGLLNSKAELEAALRQAQANMQLARTRLDQVKAGAKAGDVAAQRAEVSRTQVELQNAQVEYQRAEDLFAGSVLSKSELDLRRVDRDTKAELLEQAKERLQSLGEVRTTDINVAQAQVAAAEAEEERARAELDAAIVRSPVSGTVIKINARPGEEVGPRGIMEIADTAHMYVIAEVPESQIAQVKSGDHALISGDGLGTNLSGTVEQVGTKVGKNELFYTDAAALSDARVIEVKVRLDDGKPAEHLIHAQARVLIQSD